MRRPIATYALTLATVAAAWLARWLLDPWLADQLPFVTFFVAVAVTAWLIGTRPALLATGLGLVLAWYFFTPNAVLLATYSVVSLALVGLGEILRRTQRTAEERHELLRTTLASIGDAVVATDNAGRVTSLNRTAETLTGWSQQEAVGRPLDEVFRIVNEQSRHPLTNPVRKVLAEGEIVGLANHTVLIARDGTECPIDDSAAPIRTPEGQVMGVVLVFRDVTVRRLAERAQELERRLASIVESSDDVIISKSLDGVIRSWNATAERVLGYTAEQAVGRHISLIIPADRADEENRILARLRAGERVEHFDTVRVRSDGQLVQLSLTISPIKDAAGRVIGASKIARDITERKLLEEELRKYAADLSEADHRKNEFLAMLAHELRNPLVPIRNSLRILRLAGADENRVQSASDVMERQIDQMVRLIDDLLDLSRISRGKMELRTERVGLAAVVTYALEGVRPLVERLNHELTVTLPEQPIHLNADPTRLAQVVGNLLNNACKFTRPGGRIRLTVERDVDHAVIRVEDNGIGISEEQFSRIFEMFTQVDTSLERSYAGLGIGLTLVRTLVEMHGGTVEVHSAGAGRGSEFVVRLPILPEADQPLRAVTSETTPATAHRILVVDDNRDSVSTLAVLLRLSGNETRTAYDGLEAVEAAEAFRPDVVLLDIGLPKLNGYEACRRIREQAWGKKMMLVAITGWGQEEDRGRSREAGFDGHLVKPVDHTALMKLLASLGSEPGGKPTKG